MTDTKSIITHLPDYGIYSADACDPLLRSRVIATLQQYQKEASPQLAQEQLTELATYISQLEDALLRYHWGGMEHHEIHEILKCSTGLDIEARANELASMTAADA